MGPQNLRQLITDWFKDHPNFALDGPFALEVKPEAAPLPTSAPLLHMNEKLEAPLDGGGETNCTPTKMKHQHHATLGPAMPMNDMPLDLSQSDLQAEVVTKLRTFADA